MTFFSIKFYDDLIISKAADEDRILLWKIDGFSTMNDEVQPESIAPIVTCTDSSTKSAFGGKFQRLLILDAIGSSTNWMRFGLFHEPGKHPILALGQDTYAITTHKMDWSILFWDVALLEEGLPDRSEDKDKECLSQEPLTPFPPHKKVKLPRLEKSPRSFCIRSIAWSPGGEWCVAVDESCYIHVLSR
jgi:polycomb protein EED